LALLAWVRLRTVPLMALAGAAGDPLLDVDPELVRAAQKQNTLKRRVIKLQVETLKFTGVSYPGLRITFKATKTTKKEPNTCEVGIYNLSREHREALTKVKRPIVVLEAGYENETTQLFYGETIHTQHTRKGADIITTLSTSDGGPKLRTARIKQNFAAGAKASAVLKALVDAMGVKVGNLKEAQKKIDASKAANLYIEGVTLQGHAPNELDALCKSAGFEWSIQDGALQVVAVGQSIGQFATVLTDSLMLTTPSVSNKNIVEGQTFIQHDFLPGRQIKIRTELVEGSFRLEKCTYHGDTYGDDWFTDFEAKGPPPK
jgi:hypothetical protein